MIKYEFFIASIIVLFIFLVTPLKYWIIIIIIGLILKNFYPNKFKD